MLKIKIFTFLIICIFFSSCNKNDNSVSKHCDYKNERGYGNIQLKKQILINIDSSVNYLSYQSIVKGDSLMRTSSFGSVIDVYSIKSKKKIHSYHFADDGLNKVTRFKGSGVVSLGSDEFLIGTLIGEIYKTKNDSVIFKDILKEKDLFSSKEYWIHGRNSILPIKKGNNVFFHKTYQYLQEDKELYYNQKLLVKYNIKSRQVEELEVLFPSNYHHGLWNSSHLTPSFTLNDDKIIISFPISSELYVYDINTDSMNLIKKCVKSKYENKEVSNIKSAMSRESKRKYTKEQVRYFSITYDKTNDIYYRLIMLPVENDVDLNSKDIPYIVTPLVLMVLDKEFNVLSEKRLSAKKYNCLDFFVNEEGFWLSNNNPKNPSFDEDKLSFSLFSYEVNN